MIETGGGGGFGDPAERAPKKVEQDLTQAFISAETAQRFYGIGAAAE